ncbi:hypothetical protein PoB_003939500 [Plakobranchus ocellatus]|uniref:Uncharacterized protein n=1 Tax=Plakobranchus ocellatus TaxID=259542 RepID=A0AAV4B025_9GAST|nr:hypothetical protein PoB_003939500 [Plakobranchus ocellatus]
MVEEYATQRRQIKEASVFSVAHDLSPKNNVPTDRACPSMSPRGAPTPLRPVHQTDGQERRCVTPRSESFVPGNHCQIRQEMHWHTRTAFQLGVWGTEATGSTSCGSMVQHLGYPDQWEK